MPVRSSTAQINFLEPILVDCFAGGGGWSTGAELATGKPIHIAINHDPDAITMHETNHPFTHHYCESIYDVDPVDACAGRPVGWAHFSPDCKDFSKAKGGKPKDKNIRGLAWMVVRWAAAVHPTIISLENVEEFQQWGPVKRGKPIKNRRGETFKIFVARLESLGYQVEWRELRACDYGAPTIRKRFFLLARNDGKPIVWPDPTHGAPDSPEVKSGQLEPWRTAAEIVDWSLPCPSIFERKRPLAKNTLRRVAKGVDKFTVKNPHPFIVQVNHSGEGFRGQSLDEPMPTATAKNGCGAVVPSLTKFQQNSVGQPPEEPLDTVMAGATRFGVVSPILTQYHNEKSAGEVRSKGMDGPLPTVDTSNRHAYVAPLMTAIGQTGFTSDRSFNMDQPTLTQVTKQEQCLLTPTLVEVGYGEAPGQQPRAPGLGKPLGTVVSKPKHAVVAANMFSYRKGMDAREVEEPVDTISTIQHAAISTASMVKMKGQNVGHKADEPLHTITAGGLHFGVVEVRVERYTPGTQLGHWPKIRDLFNEFLDYDLKADEVLVFNMGGVDYVMVDIGLRMLCPRELYNAQGFPPDYIIDVDKNGKSYPLYKQVARCGNAVPPPFATALIRANWPEICAGKNLTTMADFTEAVAV